MFGYKHKTEFTSEIFKSDDKTLFYTMSFLDKKNIFLLFSKCHFKPFLTWLYSHGLIRQFT